MENLEDTILKAKDKMPEVTPTPPGFHSQATAYELKSRLNWGEPGLTIVDVRDRSAFNECRIMGAITMPMSSLQKTAESGILPLLPRRDIYVYGATDEDTASAANTLRQAGYNRVAELKGGLSDWQEIGGPVEGSNSEKPLTEGSFNVGARLKEFAAQKEKEKRMK
jgi:rhodanese-related sulfurtransferase